MSKKLFFMGPGTMPGKDGKSIYPGDEIPSGLLSDKRIASLKEKGRISETPPRPGSGTNRNLEAENRELTKNAAKMAQAIEERDAKIMEKKSDDFDKLAAEKEKVDIALKETQAELKKAKKKG
jgi:hypothetical protein